MELRQLQDNRSNRSNLIYVHIGRTRREKKRKRLTCSPVKSVSNGTTFHNTSQRFKNVSKYYFLLRRGRGFLVWIPLKYFLKVPNAYSWLGIVTHTVHSADDYTHVLRSDCARRQSHRYDSSSFDVLGRSRSTFALVCWSLKKKESWMFLLKLLTYVFHIHCENRERKWTKYVLHCWTVYYLTTFTAGLCWTDARAWI